MHLTTTTLSLALFGVVSCASSNRKTGKKSKGGLGGCSTFLKLFVDINDRNERTSYYPANFKFGASQTCSEPAPGFELCTG